MAKANNRRQRIPGELGAATSCPPSSEGAGRKRTLAMEHRAVLRPYLHGMEEALGIKHRKRGELDSKRAIVRYADDFCVFCESQEDAEASKHILTEWLSKRGLVLSPEKTKIVHLTEGFNFLSFNMRLYRASNTKTGWKLLTKPSKEAVQKHRDKMKQEWEEVRGWNAQKILWKLNPIIRGWANYHRTGTAKETFNKLDDWMFYKEVRHVKRTHPHKPKKWGSVAKKAVMW